jgi:hypothetical protein
MSRRIQKAIQWSAQSLNEYADYEAQGELVPNHSPQSPMFWFSGLARETAGFWKVPELAALLNENAKCELRRLEIEVTETL